ncbi:MAG: DUF5103 domain-containing protein [Muribaculaceae bacterium]|nr:DUF5103 domain-containing protein [Muribaculaceae bacterium]
MVARLRIVFLLLIISILPSLAREEETATGINFPSFRTLKTGVADNFMSIPVIRLGSGERLQVSFDEISEDNRCLSARLVHCNSDWKPSQLVESEYLDGFNTMDIEDYAYSSNTFVHYVNYLLEIPNESMNPLVSGNYLLQVYDRDDPSEVILQTRFRVVEPVVGVAAVSSSKTDRGINGKWQQLAIQIDGEGTDMGNPYQDLKIEVMQNGRESTSRFLRAPLRVEGSRVIYEHSPELLFPASNEYRRFESTSVRFPGMRVDSTKYMGTNYHTWINVDYPRDEKNYEYDRTQHGRFLVREYNSTDSNIGADYITVHFFLDVPEYIGKEVYIDGEFTNGKFGSSNRMSYNRERMGYELEIPLKQGAYNYQYVVKQIGENVVESTSTIEGDKYETENEYNIFVYIRKPGDRYDRLIGYATVYSQN